VKKLQTLERIMMLAIQRCGSKASVWHRDKNEPEVAAEN
jgi:hypothetical protein